MSRVSKWKLDKTKVKVVFRLQFHATHIPQTGWDKLFISFIPVDTGKPTAKTTKANVRNGSCKWGDPIYETTRLLQDSKSKQYDEKLYKIVVSMGSSRSSILGEATINLADYVDALKPSAVTLPLSGCNFGTVLHMTVQLLTSKTGFREFEQQRELRETGLQSGVDGHGHSVPSRVPHSEEVSARIKLKADATELSSLDEEANLNEECSSNTSGSLYAEKHETCSTHEVDSLKSISPCAVKEDPSDHQNTVQGTSGSARGWGSDNSVDNELAMACEENNRLKGSLELAESSFFNLKLEVSSLQSLADDLGSETQKFSHQLSAEISSAEELAKEVSTMKSECLKFKDDLNRLKDLKVSPRVCAAEASDDRVVQDVQLRFLNGISVVEGKIKELQKKAYVLPKDGDTKFIYLELEALLDFLLDFKLRNGERADVSGLGSDLCDPEGVIMGPPVSEGIDPQGAIEAMKGQIFDLVRELEESKVEKEILNRKMGQMECYYEALIQELEENQKRLVLELQHLTNEHTTCLYALSVSKTEVESLREETNQQMLRFVDERVELEAINKELERRATTSESALRRARLNYSIAVDKLQKDLELLSSQVFSMFETNENLIKQALPSQPDPQTDRSLSEDDGVTKLSSGLRKRSVGGDVLLEDLKASFLMQEELYHKAQEELIDMYSTNLNLDIYSKTLEQSLCEADADMRITKGRMDELLEELKLSTASQSHLMVSLQTATDEIRALNEYKSSSISQCGDLALQNQILEEKLASISEENYLLSQKVKDIEDINLELGSYQSKYAACLAENAELSLHLKQEASENENLTKELSHLKEKLMILKAESDELVSSKENLKFVQDKLANLLTSYDDFQSPDLDNLDINDAILRLEEIQHDVCAKNRRLMEENRNLRSEKADADMSLNAARSEILMLKHKFRSGVQDMVSKLDSSNALVDKLQTEFESVANKFHLSSEIEEEFAQRNKILLTDLALLETQMQELACKNGHLDREISGLDSLAEELGKNELNVTELMHSKQELIVCLQEKTDESIKLSREKSRLVETLETLRDELRDEKAYKAELEGKVRDHQDKLLVLEQQRGELLHVRKLASDLEMEKLRLARLLGQQNELIMELEKNSSQQASFESHLLEMHDFSLAADVRFAYVSNHYEAIVEELQKRYHQSLAREADWRQENGNLLASVESLRSDLEVSGAQNKLLSDSKDEIRNQLEECTTKLSVMESRFSMDSVLQNDELLQVRKHASELETEKSRLARLLDQQNELIMKLEKNKANLESQLEDHKSKLTGMESRFSMESVLQNDELLQVRKQASDLEMEKSRLARLLDQQNGLIMKLETNKANLESQLEDHKSKLTDMESRFSMDSVLQSDELLQVRKQASGLETEKSRLARLLDQQSELIMKLEKDKANLESQLEDHKSKLTDMESRFSMDNVLQNDELLQVRKQASDLEMEKSRLARLLAQRNEIIAKLEENKASFESQLLEMHDCSLAADVRLIYVSNHYEAIVEHMSNQRSENKLLSESNDEIRNQLEDCKRKLTATESRFSTDSILYASEIEQLKSVVKDSEEEIDHLTLSKEELEILVILLKGKVDEQTTHIALLDEYKENLSRLRSQFRDLSHRLAEQVLKTEEFKNLSIHLKAQKDKAEAEKRETDTQSVTNQDSLRVAFIKEQCETKVQELKQQVSVSKKHGEEMLLKLQDAIDEIENRKKCEAMSLKKNEELSVRLSALETELTTALSEKREKSNAYDLTKAELECALLSLECCREEKEKLGASLREFEAEKSRLVAELASVKSSLNEAVAVNGSTGNSSPLSLKQDETFVKRETADSTEPITILDGENGDSMEPLPLQMPQDVSPYLQSNGKDLDLNTEHLGAQRLRSSIEHLHEELEKMKNENTVFSIGHDVDSGLPVTHREFMQLHKANEELRSMFPSFCEISSGGNALDRVLALEIELAEALKTKNKSNIQFQSSFLKQHSDEEAVFKSFRDINELIREMLELKDRHAAMDAELREMHDRYSQLSLQFAEVEGERQKLRMTLKNVRLSNKIVSLNRSSSNNLMDNPS